ncbi:ComEC/Rec2 family competence protein [Microbacterium sp. SORGH_AS_0888]|uniref:ComEC/Rec2 family competence protein n=1 Tax=Microbacterium sp. SORGH_AS_0888 TaxID=3041791 RepID=UPI002784BEA9|nr:ComEC/Rec2 family competence protein [Microbacterium sp. SORGH_AS_0888]MDQ1128658.1 competence protein ComEC [Microbacterium sp. SORGH_AS_0888]
MTRAALRLVPAAVVAWAAAALCILTPGAAVPLALVGALAALAATALLARAGSSRIRRRLLAVVVAAGAAAAVGLAVAAAEPGRSAVAAAQTGGGRALVADVVVTGKLDRTAAGGLRADATLIDLRAGPHVVRGPAPVVLLLQDAPPGLDMGAGVRLRATAFAAGPGERAVLVLRATGVEAASAPTGLLAVAADLRGRLRTASAGLPGPGAGLVAGLAVGDTRAVSADVDADMKAASLTHLVAVSGANCAIVVGAGFGLGALLRLRRGIRVAIGAVSLCGFVVLVTPEPSVVRAAAMAGIAMLALLTGRAASGLSLLSIASTTLLVIDPWLAFELGFVLSVAATAALLVLARPLAAGLRRWMPGWLALALAVPLAAQIVCGPIIVLIAPQLTTYGVVANLLAAPAAPVATVTGLLACLAAAAPWAQSVLLWLAWVPASWIAATAHGAASLPGALLPWPEGIAGLVCLALAGGVVVCAVVVRGDHAWARVGGGAARGAVAALAGCAAGAVVLTSVAAPATVPSAWSLAACDIGQGDAIVLRSAGRVMLVDAGPKPEPLEVCLRRLGVGRIDVAVLTHFDLDHVGGAPALAGRVDTLLHGPVSPGEDRVLATVGAAETLAATAGMTGTLGDAAWRVLWPPARSRLPPGNDSSVVLEIAGGGIPRSILLADLGAESERALAASGELRPPYQVVKVSHHGSADQDAGFYRALRAAVAIVSVGADNDYGHPRAETLALLTASGTAIARTDLNGMLMLDASRGALTWWRERAPPETATSEPADTLETWQHRGDRLPRSRRSRSCPGVRRGPLPSCWSPVPRRSAPSGRSPGCATSSAPRIRASR